MKKIDFETFNKDFSVKKDRYSKWEKAYFTEFVKYLDGITEENPPLKDDLPQFSFNMKEGGSGNMIEYPVDFLVTEVDLPKAIKEKVKEDEALTQHWKGQFRSWYRKIRRSENIPYWLMYITSSGYGFRFVVQADKPIRGEAEYKAACVQFLELLESYGIGGEYHDLSIINKGWYSPTYERYLDVRGSVFSPELKDIISEPAPNKTKYNNANSKSSQEAIENVISQIEQMEIDITSEYNDWVHIGFALAHSFKEEGRLYFHRISKFHPDYNQTKCDGQYNSCIKSVGEGITLGTLFYIARGNGIQIPSGSNAIDERFWYITDRRVRIDYDAYYKLLHIKGIGRLATQHGDDIIFIKIDKAYKFVKPISKIDIWDFSIQLVENLNTENTLKRDISNAFLGDSKILMPKNYAAIRPIAVDFMVEDANTMYFYFTNCFVTVTKNRITTHTYNELKGYIWGSQIIPREFRLVTAILVKEKSEFYTFIQDVSRDMNHDKDPAVPKSIVFMDASLNKDTKGRTGKGIVKTGLGKMRKLVKEDGKRFDFRSQFGFSQVALDTNILFIDDVSNRFDFEKLFSVLTEGVVVEKKHKDKFYMSYEDSPKILITTNYAIQGSGDSFEGRIYEYEFSDYYKYGYSPLHKFGHRLFEEWDQEQWNLFDNFMVGCCKTYLRSGLKESRFINLPVKKIIAKTGFAFGEYLSANIELNKKYEKQAVFEDFINENPTYKDHWGRNKFTIHMKEYYKLKGMEVKESHSGTTHYFMVSTINHDLS